MSPGGQSTGPLHREVAPEHVAPARAAGRSVAAPRRPDLDSLYCINPDGSRNTIHPADVRGRFQTRKKWLWTLLIAIYAVLPWIEVGGHPLILLDIPRRHFYLFGQTFNAQDFYLGFFFLTGLGFALIVLSALFGRVWCGYACPQTVFLEGVFRRVERWLDGSAAQRRKLAELPWGLVKLVRRGGKYAIYVVLSLLLAHMFLAYFMPVRDVLAATMSPPSEHPVAFTFVMVFTAIMYFNFVWFREQLCIVICPYGRLQGVLADPDTVNVAYDRGRGEPRGHHHETGRGDCIDCYRCVAVCPTGIDIRNGSQLECVGCANCIDACDEVMQKLDQPPGLIRYDSQRAIEGGGRRFLRPRVYLYAVLLLLGAGVFAWFASGRTPFEANLVRLPGPPYTLSDGTLRNQFAIHLINKQPQRLTFQLESIPTEDLTLTLPLQTVELDSLGDQRIPVIVEMPRDRFRPNLRLHLRIRAGELEREISAPVVGPR